MKSKEEVLAFATKAHEGHKRKDGKDYITHPIAVAEIALELFGKIWNEHKILEKFFSKEECELMLYSIAILHDTVEDVGVTHEEILDIFGKDIARGVEILTRKEDQSYYDYVMSVKSSNDIFAKLVKLADLTHNLSDLGAGSLKDKYSLSKYIIEISL